MTNTAMKRAWRLFQATTIFAICMGFALAVFFGIVEAAKWLSPHPIFSMVVVVILLAMALALQDTDGRDK